MSAKYCGPDNTSPTKTIGKEERQAQSILTQESSIWSLNLAVGRKAMRKRALQIRLFNWTAVMAALACLFGAAAQAQQPICSAWLIESSRFMNVPFGSFG